MCSKDFKEYGAKYIDENGTYQYCVYARVKGEILNFSVRNSKMESIDFTMTPELFRKFCMTIISLIGHLPSEPPSLSDILDK